MALLNKVAQQIPLNEDTVVKPKKRCKRKIISSTKTNEIDDGKCKQKTDKIILSEKNAMEDGLIILKKRGCKPKAALSQKECETEDGLIKPKKRT